MIENSFKLFQKQREYLEKMQSARPDLFEVNKLFTEEEVLPQIGITTLDPQRPEGFLRLYPQDFIVEEIQSDGNLSTIEPKDDVPEKPNKEKFTLYTDLIKVGISTLEAINRLAQKLNITPNKIGYAGIKDAQALASQRIGLPGIKYEQMQDLKCEGFFLTHFFYNKGTIEIGSLRGNRFTIFIRTKEHFPRERLREKLTLLKENGFLNYYHTQRFGGTKLLSHILGKLILQKKYQEAIEIFLTTPNPYSIKFVQAVQLKAERVFGHWQKMKEILEHLPYTFQNEIKVLDYLIQKPRNFLGALIKIKDQTQLWVYAYASLVFNQYLSWAKENRVALPEKIPLLLSNNYQEQRLYEATLTDDKIYNIKVALQPFKFIQLKRRMNPTMIYPKDILAKSLDQGVIISFTLSKGAYATTFLMNLFKLRQGLPIPEWLNKEEIDSKKILEIGTSEPACKRLKDHIFSVLNYDQTQTKPTPLPYQGGSQTSPLTREN